MGCPAAAAERAAPGAELEVGNQTKYFNDATRAAHTTNKADEFARSHAHRAGVEDGSTGLKCSRENWGMYKNGNKPDRKDEAMSEQKKKSEKAVGGTGAACPSSRASARRVQQWTQPSRNEMWTQKNDGVSGAHV